MLFIRQVSAAGLQEAASRQPERARGVLARAIDLREALYRIFSAQAHASQPAAADIDLLNQELSAALGQARLLAVPQGFTWGWAGAGDALEAPLWPVVRSAADLLTTPAWLERVGQCADERGCGWLFLDTSKNHSRRWCDIRDCGNRAKQRRHYQRQQG
jgi:predicted RNA-binding Zn ribbon-like protein